jgi:hypothetical protein
MKRAIHIIYTHHFLYFESHTKIIKKETYYCLFQCTLVLHLQYEHILLTSEYQEEILRKELYRIHV